MDGLHDSLLAAELDRLPRRERLRFGREFVAAVRPLVECVAATIADEDQDDETEPAVRLSPWLRGRLRCADHSGHEQRTFRLEAERARVAGDPLWRCWHALAESRHLAEVLAWMESGTDG